MTIDDKVALQEVVERHNEGLLKAYSALPSLIKEHHGIEQTVLAGGYGYRQILELVQNGADAILEAHENGAKPVGSDRVHVRLRGSRLYVANTGSALSREGVEALLSSHSSPKRGNQIGRFGLGFKSLLALEGTIDLFTRNSGATRLDPRRCRALLRDRFEVVDAPGLRLAWPLEDESLSDPELATLSWAETIVRIEVGEAATRDHLRREIAAFPAEFLLFFPVHAELVLDDGEMEARELGVTSDGDELLLRDGKDSSRWRVARRDVVIGEAEARVDATHIHERDSIPMSWAVPLDGGREEAGRFWAFFPTHTPTYIRGILNAPWKLNSDRNAIIGGAWNAALMREAAKLVADTLPSLCTVEDPGRALDSFPRQLDRKDEDAAPLIDALWAAIEHAAVIPDAAGVLRPAKELFRHPRDSETLALQWQALASARVCSELTHPRTQDRLRASRLDALARRFAEATPGADSRSLRRCSVQSWFAAVARSDTATAMAVLKLAESYAEDCKHMEWGTVRSTLVIVPSNSGTLHAPPSIVLAPEGTEIPGVVTVANALQVDTQSREILSSLLKVRPLGDDLWANLLSSKWNAARFAGEDSRGGEWSALWSLLRKAPRHVAEALVSEHEGGIRVRRSDGRWVRPDEALLPGQLVAHDDPSPNQQLLIDTREHGSDAALLERVGVRQMPEGVFGTMPYRTLLADRDVLAEWLRHWRKIYKSTFNNAAALDYLCPEPLTMPRGFGLLTGLEGNANAKLTATYLEQIARGEFCGIVKFGHRTMNSYQKLDVMHPMPWYLLRFGRIRIGAATVSLVALVARRTCAALTRLSGWSEYLKPSLDVLGQASPSAAPTAPELRALWCGLIELVATPEAVVDQSLEDVWAAAAADGVVPEYLRNWAGLVPISEILVTTSPDLARRVRDPCRVVVTLDESTLQLWLKSGARNLADSVIPQWDSIVGPVDLLTGLVPELAEVLNDEARDRARGQSVSGLTLRLESMAEPLACLMWDQTLLLDIDRLAKFARADRLRLLLNEAAAAGWLDTSPTQALDLLGNANVEKLRAAVASCATLPERLLRSVGGRPEPLVAALGEAGSLEFVSKCDLSQLASLVLAHLGAVTLVTLRDTLEAEGLRPPARWNGPAARAFVMSLGFPDNFAISPESRREPEELIAGPIELPPLHDFQREVLEGVRTLVGSGTGRRRAVVSLPTGGGKTRVTVEAAARLVLAPAGDARSVIWIAQTDELCEQAVQAFRQVWLNVGAARTELRIVRLWGGNPNPTVQELDKPLVVVASIQTLNARFSTDTLAWLRSPGLVVVDECHHAVTTSYTNLMRWLDAGTRQGVSQADEPAILGLSATPFRTDDEESRRLARRFDSQWFPSDQEALYQRLQAQGVLARPLYDALHSGARLLPREIEQLERLPSTWEGLDFENLLASINQRLAGDKGRNEQLVDFIQHREETSILFFTNSVSHAQEMSLRLNIAGVPAAAVSGTTPKAARRDFLGRFQRREIRVLCNHSVLTTGFDAPKTDMVLIARQVFSPVPYMQMVGRGLRGERNGGTAQCRIVTVMDNLGRFQDRHPYHYCREYFENITRGPQVVA
jgi:superfamily II DNA or RNA helicase